MIALLLSIGIMGRQEPPPAKTAVPARLTIRLHHPDTQLERFLALFEGSKAPDPPTAYARWKRAHPDASPSKAFEAAFAALNPEMVRELKSLDGSVVVIKALPEGGLTWFGSLPGDDGTFAALATALALTDGQSVEPLDDQPVDRLGPIGAPFMSPGRDGQGALVARSRLELTQARGLIPDPEAPHSPGGGLFATLEPGAIGPTTSVPIRQILEALNAGGCDRLDLASSIEPGELLVNLRGRFNAPPALAGARLDPACLLPLADAEVTAAASFAIDPSAPAWNRVFDWADRVEKADPERAKLAPLRVRLALLAAGARVNPEAELLPHLQAISVYVLREGGDPLGQALLGLHLKDEKSAQAFVTGALPRLAKTAGGGEPLIDADRTLRWPQSTKTLSGLEARAVGKTVWIGWNKQGIVEGKPRALDALSRSAEVSGRWSSGLLDKTSALQRVVLLKPHAFNDLISPASRITWTGRIDDRGSHDSLRWTGLRAVVHGVLDRFL